MDTPDATIKALEAAVAELKHDVDSIAGVVAKLRYDVNKMMKARPFVPSPAPGVMEAIREWRAGTSIVVVPASESEPRPDAEPAAAAPPFRIGQPVRLDKPILGTTEGTIDGIDPDGRHVEVLLNGMHRTTRRADELRAGGAETITAEHGTFKVGDNVWFPFNGVGSRTPGRIDEIYCWGRPVVHVIGHEFGCGFEVPAYMLHHDVSHAPADAPCDDRDAPSDDALSRLDADLSGAEVEPIEAVKARLGREGEDWVCLVHSDGHHVAYTRHSGRHGRMVDAIGDTEEMATRALDAKCRDRGVYAAPQSVAAMPADDTEAIVSAPDVHEPVKSDGFSGLPRPVALRPEANIITDAELEALADAPEADCVKRLKDRPRMLSRPVVTSPSAASGVGSVPREFGPNDLDPDYQPPVADACTDDDDPLPAWGDRLVFDENVSDDSPVVKGTWVTVAHVVSLIVDGYTWADILRVNPELDENDIRACLAYSLWAERQRDASPSGADASEAHP